MASIYYDFKKKQQKEFSEFPMAFAFSEEQLKDGLKKLGLKETEKFKVFGIGGGGFIRKTDSVAFGEMNQKLNKEFNDKIKNDDNFVYEAFLYELGNHEYCITWDLEPTLDSLGLTREQVENDERLSTILKKARTEYNSHSDEY